MQFNGGCSEKNLNVYKMCTKRDINVGFDYKLNIATDLSPHRFPVIPIEILQLIAMVEGVIVTWVGDDTTEPRRTREVAVRVREERERLDALTRLGLVPVVVV